MKTIAAFFASILVFFSTTAKSVITGKKPIAPTPTIAAGTPSPSVTAKPTTGTPTNTIRPTAAPTSASVSTSTTVKTPTWALANENYVIALRPGESIRVTTMVPQKGHSVISVELPPSGAPPGVYFTTDQEPRRSIFIHAGPSAQPGKYTWRQSFITTFDSGVAPGNLSLGIDLTIYPAL